MTDRLGRAWVLAIALCLVLAFGVAGCGGSGGESTSSVEAAPSAEAETEGSGETESEASGELSESELLSGVSPPSGSKLLDERSSKGVVYQHYSTNSTPKEVEALYGEELEAAGWSIVNSGGAGGGWGPYGGSDYGLTAKREEDYFDLEAGGQSGATSYFEICAGNGTREECDDLSNESNSSSGGSESGEDSESSSSGGS